MVFLFNEILKKLAFFYILVKVDTYTILIMLYF